MRYAWTLLLWPGLAFGAQIKPRDINGTGDVEAALVCEERDLIWQQASPNRFECWDPADDSLLVGNGGAFDEKALPSCTDSGGNHLNYDQATNSFSCGTSTSGIAGCTTDRQVPMGDGAAANCEVIDLGTDTAGNYAAGDAEAGAATSVACAAACIAASEINDGDHGDFTYASGVATLDADVVAPAEMADADHGDFTYSGGAATLDADVVAAAEMADADHGDISWSGGVASIDSATVGRTEIDETLLSVQTHATDCTTLTCDAASDGEPCFEIDADTYYVCDGAATSWEQIGGGAGGTVDVEEGDVAVVTADTLDFASGDFAVTAAGAEANIALEADPSSLGAITPTAVDAGTGAIKTGANDTITVDLAACQRSGFAFTDPNAGSGHISLALPAAITAGAYLYCQVPVPALRMGTAVRVVGARLNYSGMDATTYITQTTLYVNDAGGTKTDICHRTADLTSGTQFDYTTCASGSGFPYSMAADETVLVTVIADNLNGAAGAVYTVEVDFDTD